jgi:hypothetical protein
VTIREKNGKLDVNRKFQGTGADTDVIVGSVRAYLNALNKVRANRHLQGQRVPKT